MSQIHHSEHPNEEDLWVGDAVDIPISTSIFHYLQLAGARILTR